MHFAIEFATIKHENQTRKGSDIPYIVHPFEVAMILQKNNASDEVIIAGLLHDVLEDCEVTKEELLENFNEKIVELVIGGSEILEDRELTSWKIRKTHTIEFLKNASLDIKLLSCADKLSNIRSMIVDYDIYNDKLWDRFNAGYEDQKWYYLKLVDCLKSLENIEMYREFKFLVNKLFEGL